jgi:hypothetical protein
MNQFNILAGMLGSSDGEAAEPDVAFFTLTPKTLRYGHGSEVFPLKNIARVGKYKVIETKFPLILIILLLLAGISLLFSGHGVLILLGLLCLVGAGFGIVNRMKPRKFAFGIETCSGARRYLVSSDQTFIDKVLNIVTSYFEQDQSVGTYINFEDRSIRVEGDVHGNVSSGDRPANHDQSDPK